MKIAESVLETGQRMKNCVSVFQISMYDPGTVLAIVATNVLLILSSCNSSQVISGKSPTSLEVTHELKDSLEDVEISDELVQLGIEQLPELKGGMKSLTDNLRYPSAARETGIEGLVIIRFVVNEVGETEEVEVIQSLDPECDLEAIRLVKGAIFISGTIDGVVYPMRMSLPIKFEWKGSPGK